MAGTPNMLEIQWKKRDKNGDGHLDKDEFQAMCYDMGYFLEDDELDTAFTMLDVDGNGTIEKSEFINFWRSDKRFDRLRLDDDQLKRLHMLREFFMYFDVKHLGYLDLDEFKKMCQEMIKRGYNLKMMDFSADALDKNGDGKITFNEVRV